MSLITLFPVPVIAQRVPAFTTLTSRKSGDWRTPAAFWAQLDLEFAFTLDPCPIGATDGLTRSWKGERVFENPPYGPLIGRFLKRWEEANLAVYLLPARTDTKWFHYIYLPHAREIRFVQSRLYFNGGSGRAPSPSMVVIFEQLVGGDNDPENDCGVDPTNRRRHL